MSGTWSRHVGSGGGRVGGVRRRRRSEVRGKAGGLRRVRGVPRKKGRAGSTKAVRSRGGGSGPVGRPGRGGRRGDGLRAWFPALRRKGGYGIGAIVAVVEGDGDGWDRWVALVDRLSVGRAGTTSPEAAAVKAAKAVAAGVRVGPLAAVLAALGSPHRLRVLLKLLEGPGTYRSLRKVTRLRAGPLYHHIGHLRLAGLIGPKERDLYRLTRAGRNTLLAAIQVGTLARGRGAGPATRRSR
jgi:hypothetical protein